MKHFRFILLTAFAVCSICSTAQNVTIHVSNSLNRYRSDVPVTLSLDKYAKVMSAIVTDGKVVIPCQLDDINGDGRVDELCFTVNLSPKESNNYTVKLSNKSAGNDTKPRVYAEMILNNPQTKNNRQSAYISTLTVDGDVNPYRLLQHHGPSFESELVAYRIYFDNRQTVDIYGKFRKGLEIHETQFYPDAQQKASGWGDDILWVGQTLGVGTLRGWNGKEPLMIEPVTHRTERIIARGPIRTIIEVKDEGWRPNGMPPINMTTRYTLYAGHRDCAVDVKFNVRPKGYQFATGLINVKNSTEYSDHKGLRGCWGTDWPVSEKDSAGHKRETVGLGICIPQKYIISEEKANTDNYAFVVGTQEYKLHYDITFVSDNETFGFHSAAAWNKYLKEWKEELSSPVK